MSLFSNVIIHELIWTFLEEVMVETLNIVKFNESALSPQSIQLWNNEAWTYFPSIFLVVMATYVSIKSIKHVANCIPLTRR